MVGCWSAGASGVTSEAGRVMSSCVGIDKDIWVRVRVQGLHVQTLSRVEVNLYNTDVRILSHIAEADTNLRKLTHTSGLHLVTLLVASPCLRNYLAHLACACGGKVNSKWELHKSVQQVHLCTVIGSGPGNPRVYRSQTTSRMRYVPTIL